VARMALGGEEGKIRTYWHQTCPKPQTKRELRTTKAARRIQLVSKETQKKKASGTHQISKMKKDGRPESHQTERCDKTKTQL